MTGTLDITPLRSLIAVADAGGVHRAAASLQLSQSAVSQHVRRLERTVGAPVVEPHGRGVRLTRTGRALLEEARSIVALHDGALHRLSPRSGGPVVLGATDHAADHLLPVLVAAVHQQVPGIRVSVRLDRTVRLGAAVDRGDVDVAVVITEAAADAAEPVGVLPLTWCAAPGWTPPPPGQQWPLLAIEAPCVIRARAVAALASAGGGSRVVGEAGHLGGVVNAARAGLGVALLAVVGRPPEGLVAVAGMPPVPGVEVSVRSARDADPEVVGAVSGALRLLLEG